MHANYLKQTPEGGRQEALYERILEQANNEPLFSTVNNIRLTKVALDYAEGELVITPHSLNPHGYVHGGCLATLADTVSGAAVYSRGKPCVTLNYSMDYFAPATGEVIHCVARPAKVGKTVSVYQCQLHSDRGVHIANGNFTFYILDKNLDGDVGPAVRSGA